MVLITAIASMVGTALAGKGDTRLISRQSASAGGDGGDAGSSDPSVSRNGRFIAFATDADNLGGPANDVTNVYVYDTEKRKVRLVSRQSASAGGEGQDQSSFPDPEISANGRFVTFLTDADNLGGPAQDVTNVYVYDLEERKVRLVSRRSASAGGGGADSGSGDPTLSGNGRFITFRTSADNLGGPTQDVTNVYVYDREERKVRLVSRRSASAGGEGADQNSSNPSISSSGRFVA
ncbi:MAG: TolB family protein, partial [Solirubrobacterales bacterium]